MNNRVTKCPMCGDSLVTTQLTCRSCSTKLEGNFQNCKFCQLPQDQMDFLESFVRCRGVIRDVEKDLGISYPTVRSRLDKLLVALGYEGERSKTKDQQREDILEEVKVGNMTTEEAVVMLRRIG